MEILPFHSVEERRLEGVKTENTGLLFSCCVAVLGCRAICQTYHILPLPYIKNKAKEPNQFVGPERIGKRQTSHSAMVNQISHDQSWHY